jgi:hypothetical protein
MKTPDELLVWLLSRAEVACRLPFGVDADAALDRRERPPNEEFWTSLHQAVKSRMAARPLSEEDHAVIERIAEVAFRRVFDVSQHHDLAALVSDDLQLLAEASLVGYDSPVLNELWSSYERGIIPIDFSSGLDENPRNAT